MSCIYKYTSLRGEQKEFNSKKELADYMLEEGKTSSNVVSDNSTFYDNLKKEIDSFYPNWINKKANQISAYYKEAVRYGGGLNAQSEKLFNHFIYKNSALVRRCIIPVTGFNEPHEYKSKKYPFHIKQVNNDMLSLAGLYTIIDEAVTFTILTKEASPLFAKIHNKKNRQPIILRKEFEQEWLKDNLTQKNIQDLIKLNFPEDELAAYTVSKNLFSPKINSNEPSILNEVKYEGVQV